MIATAQDIATNSRVSSDVMLEQFHSSFRLKTLKIINMRMMRLFLMMLIIYDDEINEDDDDSFLSAFSEVWRV